MTTKHPLAHGIDIAAPGGVDRLFALHRSVFGDAVMGPEDDDGDDGSGEGEPGEGEAEKKKATPDLGDAGKRAIAAERKAAKAATTERDALAARLKEYEDRDKSAEDKASERLAAAEARAVAAETRAIKADIAAETGIKASLIFGSDEKSIREHAEALAEAIQEARASGAPEKRKTPKPDPSQGGSGGQPLPRGASGKAEAERRAALRAN